MLNPGSTHKGKAAVANWILIGVGMLLVQVMLGGVTRLTGSGLSITEWNVITGTLPPLNENRWVEEFNKYKETPQYQLLNTSFTLADFKFIFFWEWFHRFWARLIGVVFIVGFVWLSAKKYLKKEMAQPLLGLFLLGALQGAVGWIMVASGLTGDAVYVKPTRLALHFVFALGLIAYAFWFYLELQIPKTGTVRSTSLRKFTWWLLVLLVVQLLFGALMAGHKAATAAPTWPDINGSLVPEHIFNNSLSFIENKITIHFVHRMMAYLLFVLIMLYTLKARRITTTSAGFQFFRNTPAILVIIQLLLGIVAVMVSPRIVPNHWGLFEWLAQLHQIVGLLLTLSLVAMLYVVRKS